MTHPGGAPSKLTPAVREAIVEYVRSGFDWLLAHEFAGISRRSAYRWRLRGMQEQEGIYHALLGAIDHAATEFFERIDHKRQDSWEWATGDGCGAVGTDSPQNQSAALLELIEHQRLVDQRVLRALGAEDPLIRLLLGTQSEKG